ncbi:MAG: Gfo/Idh/MocA family oxidoreductase [Armatimonadota bacterium]|nr:Gfo/Idh/MocA family oxidoreductase [Armatimonadota bacterium]
MTSPANTPLQIGIIGCGVIAQHHARALREWPEGKLVAVADLRAEAARKMADEFGVAKVYTDPQALLADADVEAVILALPTHVRTQLGLDAFRAGKHVLIEKPVAMNAGEVQALIAARGDLVAGCCSSRHRFTETARRATDFIASGALGELRHLRCRAVGPAGPPPTTAPPVWRLSRALNGGGILVNWGCYDLDFLLGVTGWSLVPRRVLGNTYGPPPQFAARLPAGSDAETHALGFITFEGGVTLSYERAELYPGPADTAWEITGTEGTLRLAMVPREGRLLIFERAPAEGGTEETVLWSGPEDWGAIHNGPARDFAAAIRENRSPLTTLEQALIVAKISDAIYASAESGEVVEIA